MPSFDESLPLLALAPAEPPCAPDEPPIEPDEPLPEPVTDELPRAPVPDDELPMAPDEPVLDEPDREPPDEPDAGEPVDDEPVDDEPDEPLAPLDEPLRPPLLPDAPEPPVAPALPELLAPPMAPLLEPVAGLALDDALPDRLPEDPALADDPLLPLPRLPDLSWLDWSLPMLLPCLLASTPFPSLDF